MLCFSYGSNMSRRRMRSRLASARVVAVATLPGHELKFHKVGRKDNSAKCDAAYTGKAEDRVIGIVYEISRLDKMRLNLIEGLGFGYEEKQVELTTVEGSLMSAWMYYATDVNTDMKPYHWYKQHVLAGAKENELPAEYLAGMEAVESIKDPDVRRAERELAIYD